MTVHKFLATFVSIMMLATLSSCDDPVDAGTDTGSEMEHDTGTGDAPVAPLEDYTTLAGKVFFWDMEDRHWATPRGSGKEFGRYVPDLFFEIVSATAEGALEIKLGTALPDGTQDPCTATTTITGSIDADGYSFSTSAIDFLTYAGNDLDPPIIRPASMYQMVLTGQFIEEGAAIQRGTFTAQIDFRELYELFHLIPDSTPEKICKEVPDYGAYCEACPSDSEVYCVLLGAELVPATEQVGATMTDVAAGCY